MVKREVNKLYKHLEIDIDGIFKSMLLLKKKKYAAMKMGERPTAEPVFKRETKGLDMVRRDWCQLSKKVGEYVTGVCCAVAPTCSFRWGRYVLDAILSGQTRDDVVSDIHAHLRSVATEIRENRIPLRMVRPAGSIVRRVLVRGANEPQFIITKGLTKTPEEYPDAHSQPHVKVALRLKQMVRSHTHGFLHATASDALMARAAT
jgi:DNA polymerase alpha subunit A